MTIALPNQQILIPRFEFPVWVKQLGEPARMFSNTFRNSFQSTFAKPDTALSVLASVPWVAQWKFNNDGSDSIGANTLTNHNTATFTTGLINQATQLVGASNQWWDIANNSALTTGNVDYTICAWVFFNTAPLSANQTIISRYTNEYLLCTEGGKVSFYVQTSGGNVNLAGATTVTISTWHCFFAWVDTTAKTINTQLDNGTINSVGYTGTVSSTTKTTQLGVFNSVSYQLNGLLDNVCFAKSAAGAGGVLTAAQRAAFYNGGAGTESITT